MSSRNAHSGHPAVRPHTISECPPFSTGISRMDFGRRPPSAFLDPLLGFASQLVESDNLRARTLQVRDHEANSREPTPLGATRPWPRPNAVCPSCPPDTRSCDTKRWASSAVDRQGRSAGGGYGRTGDRCQVGGLCTRRPRLPETRRPAGSRTTHRRGRTSGWVHRDTGPTPAPGPNTSRRHCGRCRCGAEDVRGRRPG